MPNEKRWQPGDVVVVRDPLETRATRTYEALTGDLEPNLPGWPYVVIRDTGSTVALYLPEGTKLQRWNILQQKLRPPAVTRGDSVRLLFADKPYSVDCFFETGSGPAPHVSYYYMGNVPVEYASSRIPALEDGTATYARGHFYGWKVDLISPFRRTAIGFDVTDEVLDIVVRPDRSHVWKDEDEMARLVELGLYSLADADRLRAAGQEVIELIEQAASPFDDEWKDWRPSPLVGFIPELPEGWQDVAVADSEWGALHRRMSHREK